ncbi:hypothetical protein [Lysinibacillus cavernae]|uniref:hypothetical protein n=1 Tax=Lysinibacillus cavernae TaxID=2666135 RepID=UPI0012D962A3|nr:hypothetical protein [Lysinibacillus cavernae]
MNACVGFFIGCPQHRVAADVTDSKRGLHDTGQLILVIFRHGLKLTSTCELKKIGRIVYP